MSISFKFPYLFISIKFYNTSKARSLKDIYLTMSLKVLVSNQMLKHYM